MFDAAHLVFIDETAANTKMVRLSGRCARGKRLIGSGSDTATRKTIYLRGRFASRNEITATHVWFDRRYEGKDVP